MKIVVILLIAVASSCLCSEIASRETHIESPKPKTSSCLPSLSTIANHPIITNLVNVATQTAIVCQPQPCIHLTESSIAGRSLAAFMAFFVMHMFGKHLRLSASNHLLYLMLLWSAFSFIAIPFTDGESFPKMGIIVGYLMMYIGALIAQCVNRPWLTMTMVMLAPVVAKSLLRKEIDN